MTKKDREKTVNKEKYKQKQSKRKKIKQEREKRAISRKRRSYIRNQVRPYYERFRELKDKHLLFVLKDTKNMEKILLQKRDLGKGNVLLALPVINQEMIDKYLNDIDLNEETDDTSLTMSSTDEAIKGFINYYYSVVPDEIINDPESNLMVFRNCTPLEGKEDLLEVKVRPYDLNTWYQSDFTTIDGFKVYSGNKLRTFFNIDRNLGKTFVFHDTIVEILAYRSLMKKLNHRGVVSDVRMLGQRGDNGFKGLYMVVVSDEMELKHRFENEQEEDAELDEK